ncbi:MAG TPA: GNAT family N-acetyltransferase [Marmoricola sp.]
MVAITPLTEQDRAEWLPLWQGYLTFYETDLDEVTTEATFARLTSRDGAYGAIARDDAGRAVGIVHWLPHPSTWSTSDYTYLEDLFVAADVRGTGAGRALIAYVRAWAEEHGSSQVYWLTSEANTTARRLYDKVANRSGHIHYEMEL